MSTKEKGRNLQPFKPLKFNVPTVKQLHEAIKLNFLLDCYHTLA